MLRQSRSPSRFRRQQVDMLVSLLGSKWTEKELQLFYRAYRELGMDWTEVAARIGGGRTKEMVETVYILNKAYLTLSEGAATIFGFVSIMKDKYNSLVNHHTEEQDALSDSNVKDRKIEETTGAEMLRLSMRAEPKRFPRKLKQIEFKSGGTGRHALQVKLYDPKPKVLQKILFGDDERISSAWEGLLQMSKLEEQKMTETALTPFEAGDEPSFDAFSEIAEIEQHPTDFARGIDSHAPSYPQRCLRRHKVRRGADGR